MIIDLDVIARLSDADMHGIVTSGCERTALRHIEKVDGSSGYGLQLLAVHINCRYGFKETLGV